jgi:SWI/SNF related-matrix-associated actin-dependent regulator of chromatin subfamily C
LALKSSAKAAKALADAEDTQIRSTLSSLIKLTLTKLELKMSQFEELEDILEDERKGLESARMALVSERVGLKRMLDSIRDEMAKNGQTDMPPAAAQANLGTTGQGTVVNEVQADTAMEGDLGPLSDANVAQLT